MQGSRARSIAAAAAVLLAGWLTHALAQPGIYSCVDAKGLRLTADRPILECIDREQQELNPSGTVKRRVPPVPTAEERAAAEERARKAQEEHNRALEEKKRNSVLLQRYPDKAAHDKERNAALAQSDEVLATANRRTASLLAERKRLDLELEFYKKNPSRMPQTLKRRVEENEQQIAEQKRFVENQHGEKARINTRFDQELALLRPLWLTAAARTAAGPTAAPPASGAASSAAAKVGKAPAR